MRQKSVPVRVPAEQVMKDIRRATRRHFSAEDKIRIVLDGLRGEDSVTELDRAVAAAYGWPEEIATDDALGRLPEINLARNA
jgi:transposase